MLHWLLDLFFPPRCILCHEFLSKEETDLCHRCRKTIPVLKKSKNRLSFVAGWTAVWYYRDIVRDSLIRYKFVRHSCYAPAYGRNLALQLTQQGFDDFDILTYVPTGTLRKAVRGYDHTALLAKATGSELGVPALRTMKKIRHTPSQSGIEGTAHRRANVLGAYKVLDPALVRGKRILLLDDIITSGATVSECSRVLLTAGAKEVYCAAVAAAHHDKKPNK